MKTTSHDGARKPMRSSGFPLAGRFLAFSRWFKALTRGEEPAQWTHAAEQVDKVRTDKVFCDESHFVGLRTWWHGLCVLLVPR